MSSALYSSAPFRVVSMLDPALDLEAMGKQAIWQYVSDRDFSLLKFKPDIAPMVYYVKRLPESFALSIASTAANDDIKYITAFSVCVVRVDGLLTEDGFPSQQFLPKYMNSPNAGHSQVLSNEEAALFPMDERREIGEVAYKRSFLRRGRRLSLLPLPSFLTDLASRAQFSRLADAAARQHKPTEAGSDTTQVDESLSGEPGSATEMASDGETSTKTRPSINIEDC